MLLLALCTMAFGGSELVLSSDRPIVAYVNLAPHPLKGGAHQVVLELDGGKTGVQRVALRNVLQELLWTGEVEVPDNHKVQLRYANRQVTVSEPQRMTRRKLSDGGMRNVDGEWVRGRVQPKPREAPRRVVPEAEPAPAEDVFLGAVTEAGTTDGAGGQHRSATVVVRPGEGQGDGVLRLANRTTSWANLVVDGSDIPFRGERSQEITLASGPHALEVRDFREELVWQGTVWVWPGETVELQFSESAEPAAPDRPDAWEGKALPEPAAP